MGGQATRMTPEVPDTSERVLPKQVNYGQATGGAYPSWRGGFEGVRPEQAAIDVQNGFLGLQYPAGGLPTPADAGPPYTVKDGALRLARLYGVKLARHAHDRMVERTDLHPGHVDLIQRAVDTLGLPKGAYHLPLRNKAGDVVGYAQFKGVENRKLPVLATVLGPKMKPGGEDIETRIKLSAEPETNATLDKPPLTDSPPDGEPDAEPRDPAYNAKFTTDSLDPRPPGSSANTRAATRVGVSQLPLADALRKAFNDLRMTETNTIDQGSIVPETGAEG